LIYNLDSHFSHYLCYIVQIILIWNVQRLQIGKVIKKELNIVLHRPCLNVFVHYRGLRAIVLYATFNNASVIL
jgi:hypothetical protein